MDGCSDCWTSSSSSSGVWTKASRHVWGLLLALVYGHVHDCVSSGSRTCHKLQSLSTWPWKHIETSFFEPLSSWYVARPQPINSFVGHSELVWEDLHGDLALMDSLILWHKMLELLLWGELRSAIFENKWKRTWNLVVEESVLTSSWNSCGSCTNIWRLTRDYVTAINTTNIWLWFHMCCINHCTGQSDTMEIHVCVCVCIYIYIQSFFK